MLPIQFSGHGIEVTQILRDFVNKKFNKLQKHFDHIMAIHVFFTKDKHTQKAEATIHIPGSEIYASADSEDMYKTIDILLDKLMRQIDKHKDKNNK